MGDQGYAEDFIARNSLNASNAVVNLPDFIAHNNSTASNAIDLSTNRPSTAAQNYSSVLEALNDDCMADEAIAKEISSDMSSQNVQNKKIWSISKLLGNSSDKCTNEIPPAVIPAEETSRSTAHCAPSHSTVQNQTVAGNDMTNYYNVNLDYVIQNQLIVNMRAQQFASALSYLIPVMESSVELRPTQYKWEINGMECAYIEMTDVSGNCLVYLCGTCGLPFVEREALWHHQNDVHVSTITNPEHTCCPFCQIKFFNANNRRWHVKLVHPYSCYLCHIDFNSQEDITQHVVAFHSHIGGLQAA